ncbi:MAG: hypothetical protein KGY38_06040 [Desulfobacterales bacterium]|nr:hypothetical protein [Desulfobacterales bacterium]
MKSNRQSIEPLKKVTLQISAGKRPTGIELMDPAPVEFIFGLGKTGLTPLERCIEGKNPGYCMSTEVYRSYIPEFFGHIFPFPMKLKIPLDPFYLNLKIVSVEQADPREVVKAMAEITACSGCECGCGGHF